MAQGYERLREQVLVGGPGGWRLGRAVLTGKGMVAWISAWTTLAPEWPAGWPNASDPTVYPDWSAPSNAASAAPSSLPRPGQLVAVLTQMALAQV